MDQDDGFFKGLDQDSGFGFFSTGQVYLVFQRIRKGSIHRFNSVSQSLVFSMGIGLRANLSASNNRYGH
jgi:hypothetical protein